MTIHSCPGGRGGGGGGGCCTWTVPLARWLQGVVVQEEGASVGVGREGREGDCAYTEVEGGGDDVDAHEVAGVGVRGEGVAGAFVGGREDAGGFVQYRFWGRGGRGGGET